MQKNKKNMAELDGQELLNLFIKGDNSAYTAIYTKYVDSLLAYGLSLNFDRDTVKDALQDIFCKLYDNRKSLEGVENIKFYLIRTLRNRLFNIYKVSIYTSDIADFEFDFFTKVTVLDKMISFEDKKAIEERIEELLDCLTGRQREALYLRFLQEMEYNEIGVLLNMTSGSVRKLVHRGIKRIRELNISLFPFYFFISYEMSKFIV